MPVLCTVTVQVVGVDLLPSGIGPETDSAVVPSVRPMLCYATALLLQGRSRDFRDALVRPSIFTWAAACACVHTGVYVRAPFWMQTHIIIKDFSTHRTMTGVRLRQNSVVRRPTMPFSQWREWQDSTHSHSQCRMHGRTSTREKRWAGQQMKNHIAGDDSGPGLRRCII